MSTTFTGWSGSTCLGKLSAFGGLTHVSFIDPGQPVACPTVAFAQSQTPADTTPAARCLLGGKTFSPGATIRGAATVELCGTDGIWAATDKASSGCFFADAFYSVGATSAVSGSKTMIATCQPDGTWSTSATEAAKS